MKEVEKPARLLTKRDVSKWLRTRPESIDVLIRDHGFPAIFLPRGDREVLRFCRASVEAWLRSREEFLPE
ncbi:MAG: hypothetical protein H7A51_04225 [Akkermansiaceae bacterium]|nr:hypothetical protein [Akkermansiaceae bacterium]